jgi:hypothetical protein
MVQGGETQILHALGITPPQHGHIRCPFPDHEDRDPSWRWDFNNRRYFCTCDPNSGDIFDVVQKIHGGDFMDALHFVAVFGINDAPPMKPQAIFTKPLPQKKPQKRWSEYAECLWRSCCSISDEAREYLLARGCVIPPAGGDLCWHPNLLHQPSGRSGPALVARVTDAVTNEPMTLQRIWIMPDGTKADFDPPRMLLAGHAKKGGVIRLWPDDEVTLGLGVAEGIETSLSAAHGFKPIWSAIDAKNLAGFPVLSGIEALTIIADHDSEGLLAAKQCGRRWRDAGREVRRWVPPKAGQDFNDWVRE